VDFLSHPAFWIIIAAASELIALSPLKDNSIIQLGVSCTALHPSKKALISFGKPGWQRRLEFAIRQWWFELTLPAKLDKAEADWHATQPKAPDPIIVEHPDGGMSIHAPWKRDH
jgi:hypothetical protein